MESKIWKVVYRDTAVLVEIDSARIGHPTASTAEAWTRLTYARVDSVGDGSSYNQIVQYSVYDCKRHRYLPTVTVLYDKTGRIVKVGTNGATWGDEPVGSVAEAHALYACRRGQSA